MARRSGSERMGECLRISFRNGRRNHWKGDGDRHAVCQHRCGGTDVARSHRTHSSILQTKNKPESNRNESERCAFIPSVVMQSILLASFDWFDFCHTTSVGTDFYPYSKQRRTRAAPNTHRKRLRGMMPLIYARKMPITNGSTAAVDCMNRMATTNSVSGLNKMVNFSFTRSNIRLTNIWQATAMPEYHQQMLSPFGAAPRRLAFAARNKSTFYVWYVSRAHKGIK